MRPEGWAFMVISVSAVLTLVSYCYYKVLTTTKTGGRDGTQVTEDSSAGKTASGEQKG
jgi:hypothetical protein